MKQRVPLTTTWYWRNRAHLHIRKRGRPRIHVLSKDERKKMEWEAIKRVGFSYHELIEGGAVLWPGNRKLAIRLRARFYVPRMKSCRSCHDSMFQVRNYGCTSCQRKSVASLQSLPRKFNKRYHKYRKPICEACGFIPKHMAQIEVDHVDGNHRNNHPSNLRSLCANCHRLKTMVERGKVSA